MSVPVLSEEDLVVFDMIGVPAVKCVWVKAFHPQVEDIMKPKKGLRQRFESRHPQKFKTNQTWI